jgi:hypothetical protein
MGKDDAGSGQDYNLTGLSMITTVTSTSLTSKPRIDQPLCDRCNPLV